MIFTLGRYWEDKQWAELILRSNIHAYLNNFAGEPLKCWVLHVAKYFIIIILIKETVILDSNTYLNNFFKLTILFGADRVFNRDMQNVSFPSLKICEIAFPINSAIGIMYISLLECTVLYI